MIEIYPCRPEDIELVNKCASADNHSAIAPVFIVEKDGQIVGSLGAVPSVTVWLDTQRVNVRDSHVVLQFWENHLRSEGASVIGVPCTIDSPLRKYLPKVGYLDSQANLFLKNIQRRIV